MSELWGLHLLFSSQKAFRCGSEPSCNTTYARFFKSQIHICSRGLYNVGGMLKSSSPQPKGKGKLQLKNDLDGRCLLSTVFRWLAARLLYYHVLLFSLTNMYSYEPVKDS